MDRVKNLFAVVWEWLGANAWVPRAETLHP